MGLGEEVWGSERERVVGMMERRVEEEGEGTPGRGTVGESDLSDFSEEEVGDVEMAEAV